MTIAKGSSLRASVPPGPLEANSPIEPRTGPATSRPVPRRTQASAAGADVRVAVPTPDSDDAPVRSPIRATSPMARIATASGLVGHTRPSWTRESNAAQPKSVSAIAVFGAMRPGWSTAGASWNSAWSIPRSIPNTYSHRCAAPSSRTSRPATVAYVSRPRTRAYERGQAHGSRQQAQRRVDLHRFRVQPDALQSV